MSANLSFVHLIANASTLVQVVMLLLLVASVISWAVIFRKWRELQDARVAMNNFESTFWAGTDLAELHRLFQRSSISSFAAASRNSGAAHFCTSKSFLM